MGQLEISWTDATQPIIQLVTRAPRSDNWRLTSGSRLLGPTLGAATEDTLQRPVFTSTDTGPDSVSASAQVTRACDKARRGPNNEKIVRSNEEVLANLPSSPEWVVETMGIRERHIAEPAEYTSDIAARTGLDAIASAELEPNEIDLIIVATATPDRKMPSSACMAQNKMDSRNGCAAFDVPAVCAGFVYGITIAMWHSGREVTAQAVGDLAGINPIVLPLGRCDGTQLRRHRRSQASPGGAGPRLKITQYCDSVHGNALSQGR